MARRSLLSLVVLSAGLLTGLLLASSRDIGAQVDGRVTRRAAAQRSLQATAALIVRVPSAPPTEQVICAAAFLTSDTVLTAQHCVEGRLPWLVVRPYEGNDVRVSAIIRESRERDLTLLRLQQPAERARPALLSTDVAVGDDVLVVGSPMGEAFVLTRGVISKIFPHYTFPNAIPEETLGTRPQQVLMTDAPTVPGNSGGPLFDDGGNLLGISVRVWMSAAAPQGFAVGATSIRAFLEGR